MKIIKIIMVAVVWIASALGRFTPASRFTPQHTHLISHSWLYFVVYTLRVSLKYVIYRYLY